MSRPTFPNRPKNYQNNLSPKYPHVEMQNVSKQFLSKNGYLKVLLDITLNANAGEILAVVGKSGSGKSTLLNIISGLETATSGEIFVQGIVGYVPQKDFMIPWRTVIENIILPAEIQKVNIRTQIQNARDLLYKYGLKEFEKSYPFKISGGMRQKVSLIRILLQDTDIMLFDEPFSAIDFDTRLRLVKEIRSYINSTQKVAILVTHNIEEAISISDKLVLFSKRPAKILYQTRIDIPEKFRDPVNVRKTKNFQRIFERVWKLI